jgi:hypothetical protein
MSRARTISKDRDIRIARAGDQIKLTLFVFGGFIEGAPIEYYPRIFTITLKVV